MLKRAKLGKLVETMGATPLYTIDLCRGGTWIQPYGKVLGE